MKLPYEKKQLEEYASALARIASLSNLFSESKTPFIHYRATEYLYARSMGADNLSRSDIAIDVKLGKTGVGIKTFVFSGKPKFEKIAEFNKDIGSFNSLTSKEKIRRVAELRNERIDFAGRSTDVEYFVYHCIARLPEKLYIFETPMKHIDIDNILITEERGENISFTDGIGRYKFNSSKSTLFKEFDGSTGLFKKAVDIYEDPYKLLNSLVYDDKPLEIIQEIKEDATEEAVVLPLYGYRNNEAYVFERSGLNQWNASGRPRDLNEVYIPIPRKVREKNPSFFPGRDTPFELQFPSGKKMSVKVCQDDGKALMSQRNADLGEWLLRDVLSLEPGELLTYEKLEEIGIDSVEISKVDDIYSINFKNLGSYEEYINND